MPRMMLGLLAFIALTAGCATGPRPVYVATDTKVKSNASALVVGRSVSEGPELVVLHNRKTNEVIAAIRSISFNREQEFVIALEPGSYVVHRLGVHGSPIGARDKPFEFSVRAGEAVYIGTFVNDWHPPAPNEVNGRLVEWRSFGRTACTKLLCSGYLDGSVTSPYGRVGLVDESAILLPKLQAEVPALFNARVTIRLAE